MRFYSIIFLFIISLGCAPKANPPTPLETLQTYIKAIKKKDPTQMKLLLSQASLKMIEDEARAQNVTVDDIVKRDTLFSETQTSVKYRNVRENDDKASIEIEDSTGLWNTVQLIREDGVWKIDKKGFASQIEQDAQQSSDALDKIINEGRQ